MNIPFSRVTCNNPPPSKSYFNFHPLEVLSRYRDPQLQVRKKSTKMLHFSVNICKSWCLLPNSITVSNFYALGKTLMNRLMPCMPDDCYSCPMTVTDLVCVLHCLL